jgi:hypothetical protein
VASKVNRDRRKAILSSKSGRLLLLEVSYVCDECVLRGKSVVVVDAKSESLFYWTL